MKELIFAVITLVVAQIIIAPNDCYTDNGKKIDSCQSNK